MHKTKNYALIMLIITSSLVGFTMTDLGVKNVSAAPVATGDTYSGETTTWYINESTIYRNNTLYLNCSNVRINNYGDASLTLDNTTVYFEKNLTWYNGVALFDNDTGPDGFTIKQSIVKGNESYWWHRIHETSAGNISIIKSYIANLYYIRTQRHAPAGGSATDPDITIVNNTIIFSRGTGGSAVYSLDYRATKRMIVQKNNFYNNDTQLVNLYRASYGSNGNLEYHIGNNTYHRTLPLSYFRVFNDAHPLKIFGDRCDHYYALGYQSTVAGAISIYEPIVVHAIDYNGNTLSTDVSIKRNATGAYTNTTTGAKVFLLSGYADGTGYADDISNAPFSLSVDLRYEITFPCYDTLYPGLRKIINTTITMHYLYNADRYLRTCEFKYQRDEYNVTCHISPFWANYPEYYLPYLVREDDWGNHTSSGALTEGTWENDSAIFDMMYDVYTSRGFKFTWFVNEVSQSTWAAYKWNSRLDDRYIGWLNNHSSTNDGTDWVEFATHIPNHDDHSLSEHRDYPSIWENLSYSKNFSLSNMSYQYKGIAFPNDDFPTPNGTNALIDLGYLWAAVPDGERTDDGNTTEPLMMISSNWLYFCHYAYSNNPDLELNFNPYKIPQDTGIAFATFAGNQAISGPSTMSYSQYQVGLNSNMDCPYYSFTNHQFLMRNTMWIDGDELYNWTKWNMLNATLDFVNDNYDIRPMTHTEFYRYRRTMENVSYTQLGDRWVVDASSCPYDRRNFTVCKIYGDDTRIYDMTMGKEVSYTEGSAIWTLQAGHVYHITGHSLGTEILANNIFDSLIFWLPLVILLALLAAALEQAGIKFKRW